MYFLGPYNNPVRLHIHGTDEGAGLAEGTQLLRESAAFARGPWLPTCSLLHAVSPITAVTDASTLFPSGLFSPASSILLLSP